MLASFRAYYAIRSVVHGESLVSLHSGRYGSGSDRVNWGLPACASAFRGEPRRARVPTRRGSVPSPSDPAPLLGGSPDPATGFPKLRGPSGNEYRVLQRVPQMTTMFVIEDEPVLARNLVRAFAREDFHVLHAAGIAERRGRVERVMRRTGAPGGPAPTVLLLGETGSGKGHVARALHAGGGRREGPFIEVNCTALPENLVEAELFGHEKGAFTDAKAARAGLFETAHSGTILLDEIGHISPSLQSKFLKVIEEKAVRRIGATTQRRIDVQVIAATSRDLEAATRTGEFREDLYQRLSVAVIRIPPLRERDHDAVLIARALLEETSRRYKLPVRTLSPDAEVALRGYAWPGNVRELANTMERVVLFSDADPVRAEDVGLPNGAAAGSSVSVEASGSIRVDFPDAGLSLEAVERAVLVAAMEKAGGNQSEAARLLGISRDTLRYRIVKFGLGE